MRTHQVAPAQCASTRKWCAEFEVWEGDVGREERVARLTSQPFFDTEDDAYEAGFRALDTLELTGKFPDMCKPF